jgi:N-acetylglutamate synthase-like GNAT family acetyltransferase
MNRTKSEVFLRPAKAHEQLLIWRKVLGAGLNPLHLHWKHFLLAENDKGEFLGCGQIKPHKDGSRELASIYVIPEERGKGIASAIIEALQIGQTSPLWLTCRRELTDFYLRFGFVEIQSLEMMPAYFRRVKRLIGMLSITGIENPLAVMCWRCKPVESG